MTSTWSSLTAGDVFWPTRNPVGCARSFAGRRKRSAPLPPGPKGRPVLGVLPEWREDPFEYGRSLHQQYGDVVRLPLPGLDVVLLNHPDYVAQTNNSPNGEYSMIGPLKGSFGRVLGEGTPTMEGEEFRNRRRLVMPMFNHASLAGMADVMARGFAEQIDTWERYVDSGQEIDLQHEIGKASLFAFVKVMCSYELSEEQAEQLISDFPVVMAAVSAAIGFSVPMPRPLVGNRSAAAATRRLRAWIVELIDQRLADPNPPQDMLQVLVDERDNTAAGLDRRSLIQELTFLIAGGFETVVAATAWTLALLPSNRAAQQRLIAEVDGLGGALPTFDDVERLRWTKACFDEGQRLQGHPFMPRFAMQDDIIGGYHIRKGTLTGIPFYTLHRDERWWGPNADAYDPMRFYDKTQVAQRPDLSFIPFGSGQHRCIGSAMAYMNGAFLLSLIHQRYRVQVRPGWTPRQAVTFSVPVKGGLPVTLTRAPKPDPGARHRLEDPEVRGLSCPM